MFYGTINPTASVNEDGTIKPSGTFSNNFIAHRKYGGTGNNSGIYFIDYNEYTGCTPAFLVTPMWASTGSNAALAEWYDSGSSPAQINTVELGATATNNPVAFSFFAQTAMRLVFDASENTTLSLSPKITSFKGGDILTLTTDIHGLDASTAQPGAASTSVFTAPLDKGSALLGVFRGGGTMTLSIPNTVKDSSENTWDLTGWTFGGGAGDNGQQWTPGQSTSTFALSIPGGQAASPMTTPETFVIMATFDEQTLKAGTLVRLSRVPPAGLSM